MYSLFWLAFFFFARAFFLLTHYQEAFKFSAGTLLGTFSHGIKLDISGIAYILAIPFLTFIAAIWIKGGWFRHFMKWYTWIIIFVSACIIVGDSVLYTYWGFRMDYTPFLYLKTPGEALASVTTLKVISVCVSVVLFTTICIFCYNRFIDRFFAVPATIKHRLSSSFLFLFLTGALILPIRGGVGLAPINAGTVYFSEDMFVNHSAINVVWNVGSSVFNRKPMKNPYNYGGIDAARALTDSLLVKKGEPLKVLNNPRPNLLFIVLESFGNSLIGPLGGDPLTTPYLNKYSREGILFSNFYSSGNRTDKALPAIISGYPAQPAVSIIKEPRKSQSLPSLVKIMKESGYSSSFWYGGDINFANFNSYLIGAGFSQIITMENFDPSDYNSKWGVHDDVLFKALKDSMTTVKEPFFRTVLTLSSHEPFEVPMDPVFEGKDDLTKFRNSVYYTDNALGAFLDWAKTTEWWKNTLVVLVADHCRRNSTDLYVYSPEIFKIPMLWLGGALDTTGITIDKLGSQVDIPVTLLDQLDIKGDFPFSKDILAKETNSFAFYVFNEGFAYINDNSALIFDQKLGEPVVKTGKDPESAEKYGKAMLQVLFDDYLKR